MTELLIRKIRDYINYVDEILQHFYQDRETISKEFHIEQNTMEITKIFFNQDEEHFPGKNGGTGFTKKWRENLL